MGERKLVSWIDGFLEYTSAVPSPEIFRRWVAYSSIAAALQRKVWTITRDLCTYPNLYVVLVGGPGAGKSIAIAEATEIWKHVHGPLGIKAAPTSTTRQRLYQLLANAKYLITKDTNIYEYHALSIAAGELKVFMRMNDIDFQSDLNRLFDNESSFIHSIKGSTGDGSDDVIINPWLNLIGGTTPRGLKDILSDRAFDDGFGSRVNIIYSGEEPSNELFIKAKKDEKLRDALISDLNIIADIHGQIEFEPAAAAFLAEWFRAGMPPAPRDPRLEFYNRRRIIHLLKLCAIRSADQRDTRTITLTDAEYAQAALLDAEQAMSPALEFFGDNPLAQQTGNAIKIIAKLQSMFMAKHKTTTGVPQFMARQALMKEVDSRYYKQIMESLLDARQIEKTGDSPKWGPMIRVVLRSEISESGPEAEAGQSAHPTIAIIPSASSSATGTDGT